MFLNLIQIKVVSFTVIFSYFLLLLCWSLVTISMWVAHNCHNCMGCDTTIWSAEGGGVWSTLWDYLEAVIK